jgi:import receptor subunit TOM70
MVIKNSVTFRGQIYFLVQNYDKALADYERSIELDSRFPFAKIQSAVAHYRLGSTEKALQLFDEAKAQFPGSAETIYYYGEILLDQQKVDDALRAFDRAIKLNPNLPLPYLNKVNLCDYPNST